MKSTKLIPILLLFVALLSACNLASPTDSFPIGTATQGSLTLIPPTPIPSVTPTLPVTDTALVPTTTNTPLPFMALDGLRVAYIIDGNLYVQDSGKQAVQLTQSGQDHAPLFSDDGQKIVFSRNGTSNKSEIWSINVDGSGEQALVNLEKLASFGQKYDETIEFRSPAFIPTTHQLFFTTTNQDLFVVNTDTGELKQLIMPGDGGFFLASPNGKYIAVQTADHIDVIDVQGSIIHHNLVIYPADEAHFWIPMFWVQDSSELIVLPSDIPQGTGYPVSRTIWRYSLDGSLGNEIHVNPAPVYNAYTISPDGKWIVYSLDMSTAAFENLDPEKTIGVYLGNLLDGTSQLLFSPWLNEATGLRDVPSNYYGWSIDSKHFVFEDINMQLYIGNLQGQSSPLYRGGFFSWIDSNRYFFGGDRLGEVGKEETVRVMEYPTDFVPLDSGPMTFVFLGH